MSTTTTTTRPTETKNILQALNACIETCTDGEKGYATAAADVRAPALKALFQEKSRERAVFVLDLQRAIEKLGGFAENQGTAKGTIHRGLLGVRLAMEGRTDDVVIEECLRGERAAADAYRRAFKTVPIDTLPHDIRKIVQTQLTTLTGNVDAVGRLLATH